MYVWHYNTSYEHCMTGWATACMGTMWAPAQQPFVPGCLSSRLLPS